jgi:hypothetical protein
MNDREKVAHHEAAHAVLSIRAGFGVSGGIDLDAPTSVGGAYGNAAVNLLELDDALPEHEQRMDLARNIAVICAGAASDAKISGIEPCKALRAQPGDLKVALEHAGGSTMVRSPKEAVHVVMRIGLLQAVRLINCPEVWLAVERVAAAVLAAGGKLDGNQVTMLGASLPLPNAAKQLPQ